MLGVQNKCRKYSFGVDLGARIRPAMALDGRFTGSSFVRKLLQAKGHAPSKPSPLESGYRLGIHYYRWNIRTKLSELRTKTDSVACGIGPSQSPYPCRNGPEAVQRLIGRTLAASDRNLAEHAFAYTLLDYIFVDEEQVRRDTTLPLRAHDRRAHAVRPMIVSLMPTAGAGRGSAHELRARPPTSVHFPGRIRVRAAPRVRRRGDGFRLPG